MTLHNALAAPASLRSLTALPVFNEARHVTAVLDEVVRNAGDVLVVDDGSTDGTRELLAQRSDVIVVTPPAEPRLRRRAAHGVRLRRSPTATTCS